MNNVDKIIEWVGTDGSLRCILLITDEEKHGHEIDSKRIELCKFKPDEEEWQTEKTLDYIDNVNSVGIPQEMVD